MNNLFKISFGTLILFSLFLSTPVFAEQTTSPKLVVLATVNIQDTKIVSQSNNTLKITFNLSNREGVQTGVKYGVKLIKETSKGQFLVDEKVYDESLTLAEHTTITKEITYIAPPNLSGDYTVFVNSKNENGFPFGTALAGKIKLTSSVKGIEISPESCTLSVVGETGSPTYNLTQGVDISSTETLKLTCTATNTAKSSVSVTPFFETHYRTIYGEIVPQTGGDTAPITFSSLEKKSFSLLLPKAAVPQAYDIKIGLKSGEVLSNTVVIHYVLQGVSATIQNLSLDKDYYNKGDTANLSFFWTPSADIFPGSRVEKTLAASSISVSSIVTDGKGKNCAEPLNQTLSRDQSVPKVEISIPITSSCLDPQVSIVLKDSNGTVLDQKGFSAKTTTKTETSKPLYLIFVVLIFVVLAIAIVILYVKKKKNSPPTNPAGGISFRILFPFLALIALGVLLPINEAKADTFTWGTSPSYTATVNIDKSSYYRGEPMLLTGTVYNSGCSNSATDIWMDITPPGGVATNLFSTTIRGTDSGGGSLTINAPTTDGNYVIKFDAGTGSGASRVLGGTANIPFTVTGPFIDPYDAICGEDNPPWRDIPWETFSNPYGLVFMPGNTYSAARKSDGVYLSSEFNATGAFGDMHGVQSASCLYGYSSAPCRWQGIVGFDGANNSGMYATDVYVENPDIYTMNRFFKDSYTGNTWGKIGSYWGSIGLVSKPWNTPHSVTDKEGRLWEFQLVGTYPRKAQYKCGKLANQAKCDLNWYSLPGGGITPSQPVGTQLGGPYADKIGFVVRGIDNQTYYSNCKFFGKECAFSNSWTAIGGSPYYSPRTFMGADWDFYVKDSGKTHWVKFLYSNPPDSWSGWQNGGLAEDFWGHPYRFYDKVGRVWQLKRNANNTISYACGTTEVCIPPAFDASKSSVSPTTVTVGDNVTIRCDMSVRDMNGVVPSFTGGQNISYDGYDVTTAKFTFKATQAGTHTVNCHTWPTDQNFCDSINSIGTLTVNAPAIPDLTAGAPTPATAISGTPKTFTSTITNGGTATASVSFPNLFQVATAFNGGGTVTTLSVNSLPSLAAGISFPINSSPYTFTSAGQYSVRTCADNNASFIGTINEGANEGNNCGGWTNVTVNPPPPTNVTRTCNAAGNSMTVSWTLPSGYTHAYFRANPGANNGTWPSAILPSPDDVGSSYTFSVTPGQTYYTWVHTRNVAGDVWSDPVYNNFVCTATICANGANNPPTCTLCTAPKVWNSTSLSCVDPLSITVSPTTYSVTLPSRTISAIYTLTNGTSANTTCRLLDNVGNPLSAYAPCTSPMSVTAPATANTYAYSIQAFKVSTNETKTSNSFTVTVNPVPSCANGANNPPTCTLCTAPKVWNSTSLSCVDPLSITVSPTTYSVTLPSRTISAIYTLTNGTSANTTCRLLDNVGNPLSAYAPCTSPMSVTAPATANTYAYSIQAFKVSTNETKTSNSFTVTVNPVPSCANGANNPPTCNTCTLPLQWNGTQCITPPPATVSIWAVPPGPLPFINSGTQINWSSTNATPGSCLVSPTGWTGESGNQSTGPLSPPGRTYILTCQPGSASASVSVSVLEQSINLCITKNGQGDVQLIDPGAPNSNCWSYPKDKPVTIRPRPSAGRIFSGWGGDCSSFTRNQDCSLIMDISKNVEVNFMVDPNYKEF